MRSLRSLVVLAFCLFSIPGPEAQTKKLTATEAKDHIGDRAKVCGKLVGTHYAKPEDEYKGLRLCVTGKITSYRGRPEIVATERGQIEIQK
jgi:hypothetical protein